MSVVFRKTEKGFYIISPLGKLSPITFATSLKKEYSKAKFIYTVFLVITTITLGWHYNQANDNTSVASWSSLIFIVLGIVLGLYFTIAVTCSEVTIYSKKKHGNLL